MIFGQIFGGISSLASTWLQGRVEKAKAESDIKVARAKAEAKVFETEATSSMLNERSLTDQMAGSWKDEAWSLWFIAVLTCCFLPWTQPYVKEGFLFLETSTPNWFSNILYIVIGSSFGYRFGKQGLQLLNRKKQ
ncbi:MAG: hypothetical protein CBC24_09440 [Candidatus Pelagibacter sp. TMED64]|nr:MAG: hypothetical protein CBC24_09440 [Candidatus Pelagibacter sp. TMED64]|tara:strand:+ start:2149 stop:2553 length:405 start_codon:yes stop_codon:yes gene_type:complete